MGEYLDISNCTCKKRVLDKLLITCEDEVVTPSNNPLDKIISNKMDLCCLISYHVLVVCNIYWY